IRLSIKYVHHFLERLCPPIFACISSSNYSIIRCFSFTLRKGSKHMIDNIMILFWMANTQSDALEILTAYMLNNRFHSVMSPGSSLHTKADFSGWEIQVIINNQQIL